MGKLILVRHGESVLNKTKCYHGSLNPDLTEEGEAQCKRARERLKRHDYELVYSSDYIRAKRTAEIVNYKDIEIVENTLLREKNFGIFEGLTYEEIVEKYPAEAKEWFEDDKNYNFKTGESTNEFCQRVIQFADEVLDLQKNTLLVAHWGVIVTLLSYYIIGNRNGLSSFNINNAGHAVLEFYENKCVLTELN